LAVLRKTFVAGVFEIVVQDIPRDYIDSLVVIFERGLTVLTSLILWVLVFVHD
jgi:hypothetical protein